MHPDPVFLYILASVVMVAIAFLLWALFSLMREARHQNKAAPAKGSPRRRR